MRWGIETRKRRKEGERYKVFVTKARSKPGMSLSTALRGKKEEGRKHGSDCDCPGSPPFPLWPHASCSLITKSVGKEASFWKRGEEGCPFFLFSRVLVSYRQMEREREEGDITDSAEELIKQKSKNLYPSSFFPALLSFLRLVSVWGTN